MGVLDFLQKSNQKDASSEESDKEKAIKEEIAEEFDKESLESNNIIEPVISEKARDLSQENKYVFLVKPSANKPSIKREVERRWDVSVDSVNTMRGKTKSRSLVRAGGGSIEGGKKEYKKAIVTVKAGEDIDVFPV
ncbi:MAG: 50S ribosomal protein L23 [Candidatus Magasanikbacteria bacterium]